MEITIKLTIYFEGPFWVGIFERKIDEFLEVARVVFGTEPKDYEVYEFIIKRLNVIKFSMPIENENFKEKRINPKRIQRKIKKELQDSGVSTKAQQAIKLQQEEQKLLRNCHNKFKKEAEKEIKFQLKQQKKKAKHKGR